MTDQKITLNYVNPYFGTTIPENCDEEHAKNLQALIDHGEIIKFNAVSDIGALFPNATFAIVPIPTPKSSKDDFEFDKKLGDAKKEFTLIFKALTKGLDKEAKIAQAQEKVDEIVARMEIAMGEQNMEAIIALSDERSLALAELEKAQKGKASNGSGDRSNPLPPIAENNALIRKSNGSSVLALRGDTIPGYKSMKISENWQAFQMAAHGEYKGFWVWEGVIGECTSNSDLNAKINSQILDLPGSSIGVNGLTAVSSENLETIRTTQLRGLP